MSREGQASVCHAPTRCRDFANAGFNLPSATLVPDTSLGSRQGKVMPCSHCFDSLLRQFTGNSRCRGC
jgi:hypothetical protein